jgi:hypothetical protein
METMVSKSQNESDRGHEKNATSRAVVENGVFRGHDGGMKKSTYAPNSNPRHIRARAI